MELDCACREMSAVEVSRECGPSCGCELECGNRLTQRGIDVRVKIVKDEKKGWGLCSDQVIRKGDFVCEYAGMCFFRVFWMLKSGKLQSFICLYSCGDCYSMFFNQALYECTSSKFCICAV